MLGTLMFMSVLATVFSYQAHNAGVNHMEFVGDNYKSDDIIAVEELTISVSLTCAYLEGGADFTCNKEHHSPIACFRHETRTPPRNRAVDVAMNSINAIQIHMPNGVKGFFKYANCNTTAVPVFVKNLDILPDPVQPGADITLNADLLVTKVISAPIAYNMELYLRIGGQNISACEILPVSCSGNDACPLMTQYVPTCPAEAKDCHCPFKAKEYPFKNIQIPLGSIPAGVEGLVGLNLKLTQNGVEMMCFQMELCLKEC